jgi:hypothetical protein
LCDKEFSKTTILKHLATELGSSSGVQSAILKIEGAYSKGHWLYVDMPLTDTLQSLDSYMRDIWLECCGHLSEFNFKGSYEEIPMTTKIRSLPAGTPLKHLYDFGSTTECLVTLCGTHYRDKEEIGVRTLARNNPIEYKCCECGEDADTICLECDELYCSDCYEKHAEEVHDGDDDMNLPVCNSPRMGVCGYCG